MKEPYKKGVANHLGFESCAGGGNATDEALAGRRVSTSRI